MNVLIALYHKPTIEQYYRAQDIINQLIHDGISVYEWNAGSRKRILNLKLFNNEDIDIYYIISETKKNYGNLTVYYITKNGGLKSFE